MTGIVLNGIELKLGRSLFRYNARFSSAVTGVFGPSGAGKTTLLELLAGLHRPQSGSIEVGGTLLTDAAAAYHLPPEQRRIGYVPQDLALFPHKTVRENLRFGARSGEIPPHLLQVLALEGLLDRYPANLSGGEKQRVAVGRALVTEPRLLLLDEPLSSLDTFLKRKLLALFREITSGLNIPVVYVSHDVAEIRALATEVAVMENGTITRQGPVKEIFPNGESQLQAPSCS